MHHSINTLPLAEFIPIYCDKECGQYTPEQAAQFISQYYDAISGNESQRNELVGQIEALNSFVRRISLLIGLCRQSPDGRLVEALKADGFKYHGDDPIESLKNQLTRYKIKLKDLTDRYEKQKSTDVVVNYEWFLNACINMSDVSKYPIRIQDLTVKEFCIRYKQMIQYIKKQQQQLNSKKVA